jgi:hypothetical protein
MPFFYTWNIVICILCMDFVMAMHVLLLKNTKGFLPIEGFRLEVYCTVLAELVRFTDYTTQWFTLFYCRLH